MRRIAVACQGGGSHTAFTAGVLRKLLTGPEYGEEFTITALSGTSGGAICAGLAWSRLLQKSGQAARPADRKQAAAAAQALMDFWRDMAADDKLLFEPWLAWTFDYANALGNALMVNRLRSTPFAEQECRVLAGITRKRMLTLLERHIPLAELKGKAFDRPLLRIGATDIRAGVSEPIEMENHLADEVHRILLASASIPPLFGPTVVDGHYYWDGLYSHNPPLDCFTNFKEPPDEIWVIQINSEQSSHAPRSASELVDRRNELMGNLSLVSEMYHIDAMNWLLESPKLSRPVKEALRGLYKKITLRKVHLRRDLDFASKYDRSLSQMESLMKLGEQTAREFFEKRSIWTMEDKPGLHAARLELQGTKREHGRGAEEPRFTFCSTVNCPANALCNTCPGVTPLTESVFATAQKWLDFRT